ncbi:MAG: GNAT family N-acetyltransferase [Actinomycetota bacterium]|nr:GNAT family N-acetyltransferase [Actinomycetota bacterium]MDP9020993.1 GNAT family N-acetyltransferase [Actinomycetota bacterium]
MEGARLATCDDLATLARLAEEAVAEQVDERGGAIWAWRETRPLPALGSLEESLGDDHQLLLAGTIDDAVVGYAGARLERLRSGELLGVVTDLFVEPGARGVGVGEALIEEVLSWCGEHGCCGVDAVALPGNRDTKNFFETFGFTARAIVVHRRLAQLAVDPG